MNFAEVTPYLAVFAPVAGLIAALDFVVTDAGKERVCSFIGTVARSTRRPASVKFYAVCLVCSICATAFIMALTGLFGMLSNHGSTALSGVKSSAPLLLAIIFKIFVWDYALALKSAMFVNEARASRAVAGVARKRRRFSPAAEFTIVLLVDLWLSGTFTALYFSSVERIQSGHLAATVAASPLLPASVKAFFDEISFATKEAIAKSFYVLNGALLYYCGLGIAWLFDRLEGKVNTPQLRHNVFKLIAVGISFTVLVLAVCYQLAQ